LDVATPADDLPDDVLSLRAQLLEARAECQRLAGQVDRLRHIIRELQRARFGRRSERLDPDQLQLELEEREIATAQAAAASQQDAMPQASPRRRRSGKRLSLPAHLPRIEVVIEPEDTCCPCCHGAMHVIGEEKSERLDVIPAQFRVIVTRRPTYGCRACDGAVVQAPAPERLIRGGLPTEALVAFVLVSKYGWFLPLYRQARIMMAQGIVIERSVLAFWVGYAAAELMPVWRRMRELVLGSARIFVDETRAPVLDPGRGRTKSGYFWSIARDDRAWCGGAGPASGPPAVVYTYAPGRGAAHAVALLEGYTGIVQCDGYGPYKQLADPKRPGGPATLAFCWSHWRRYFYEIARAGPAPIASEALRRIAGLYAIETVIRGRSAEERRAVRQTESMPLVEELKRWLETQLATVSARSVVAQAIRYGLNHWQGLVRFLDDGRIEMDSNPVERAMRPIALTRRNALFAGHDAGATHWACVASLIESCKLNGVDPQAYLTDVLTRLVNLWPKSRIEELMPWAWSDAAADSDRLVA
jgi:transposase